MRLLRRSGAAAIAVLILGGATACTSAAKDPSARDAASVAVSVDDATSTDHSTVDVSMTTAVPAKVSGAAAIRDVSSTTSTTLPPATTTTTTTSTTTSTSTTTTTSTSTTTTTTTTTTTQPPLAGPTTGCQGVAVIGDSTAVGLDGANGVLSGADTIGAQLSAIGVSDIRLDISGGRSIVETLPGQSNGVEAIDAIQSTGFAGCWVILLGTNDAANIAAGSNADAARRVDRIAAAVAGERTLWLTASTVRTDGAWARPNTLRWNEQLRSLVAQHPNIALADWDVVASPQAWFVADGIHPNSTGLAARSRFVADNLRVFFRA